MGPEIDFLYKFLNVLHKAEKNIESGIYYGIELINTVNQNSNVSIAVEVKHIHGQYVLAFSLYKIDKSHIFSAGEYFDGDIDSKTSKYKRFHDSELGFNKNKHVILSDTNEASKFCRTILEILKEKYPMN